MHELRVSLIQKQKFALVQYFAPIFVDIPQIQASKYFH